MKKWSVKAINADEVKALSAETGLSMLVASVLCARGITSRALADDFFNSYDLSEPSDIADMDKAVEIIRAALEAGKKITVYGDYDCDGITSTVMLYSHLIALGGEADWYIPSREEGYGLNLDAIDRLVENGTELLITVDNGISAVAEAEYIKSKGVSLIITDHHLPPEVLPVADAIVDPNREDDTSEFKRLAGCGVALKLIMALEGDYDGVMEQYGDLAAVGTVGDLVPLVGENRHIVERGLSNMLYTENVGLVQLLRAAGLGEERLSSTALAFSVCPRLNAAGRFAHPKLAAELLLCENEEIASVKAQELSDLNKRRQEAETEIMLSVEQMLSETPELFNRPILVASGAGWSHGVIGIVASKLLNKYGKPVMVITAEGTTARGSARSIDGVSLNKILTECRPLMVKFGGHAKAAGFTLETENIERFAEAVNEAAKRLYPAHPVSLIEADKELDKADLTTTSVEQLSILQPCGEGNPTPLFLMKGCRLLSKRALKDGKYVSFTVQFDGGEYRCLCFGMSFDQFRYQAGDTLDLMVSLELNEYNGTTSVSIRVKELRRSGFNQDKYFAAKSAYERLKNGDFVEPKLLKRIIPEKSDIKTAYDLLRRFENTSELEDNALSAGLNYCMYRVILDVFEEFGLVKLDPVHGKACLIPAKEKADLDKSAVLKKIIAAANADNT